MLPSQAVCAKPWSRSALRWAHVDMVRAQTARPTRSSASPKFPRASIRASNHVPTLTPNETRPYTISPRINDRKPRAYPYTNSPSPSTTKKGSPPAAQPIMQPTASLRVLGYRHLRLTTKDVNKGFYKGNRTGSMGSHTRYGGYRIDWAKVRTFAVPERLFEADFKVRLAPSSLFAGPSPRDHDRRGRSCRNKGATSLRASAAVRIRD